VHLRDEVVTFTALTPTERTDRRVAELRALHHGPVGVGLARPGLAGLAQSARDARRALRVARQRGVEVAAFGDAWLAALALDDDLGLGPFLTSATDALRADPALAEAVEVHLRLGGRLRPAARHLGVHPNTLAYRLRRFAAVTGADPATLSGSLLAACALVRAGRWAPEVPLDLP
jgi:sugar diacid utilization regulator